jgi:glutamate-1-semialdehyde 2,1-aminomutase
MKNQPRSKAYFEEACRYLAGGVGSNARRIPEMTPTYFVRGQGARIWDADDNEFIDYILAWGPLILGHCHPVVTAAARKQIEAGTIFGSSIPEEIELARLVCKYLRSVELVRFTNSASEAVHMCLRLARAHTGKSKIIKFEGAYHGWFDDVLISSHPDSLKAAGLEVAPYPLLETGGQNRRVLDDIIVLPFNRLDAVEKSLTRHAHETAAIILEPYMCNNGVIPPKEGFLEGLREMCTHYDIALIFDETITGFRIGIEGAQGKLGVYPDLTVFGKGVGGGYPIAGFGGRKKIMELVAQGKVGHYGTYNSNSLCVAAALATLSELSKEDGRVFDYITTTALELMNGLKAILKKHGIPAKIQGPGPFFSILFTDRPVENVRDTFRIDKELYSRFWQSLFHRGIRIWPSARGLWYLSAAHSKEEIQETLASVEIAARSNFAV